MHISSFHSDSIIKWVGKVGRGGGSRTRDLPVSVRAPAARAAPKEPLLQPGALSATELRPDF